MLQQTNRIAAWQIAFISLLLVSGILKAGENYVKNGDFEQVKDNKLTHWESAGKVEPEVVGGVWRSYTVRFNSGTFHEVNFYFCVSKGSMGSIWIDNITASNLRIKNAGFEEKDSDGRLTAWNADNWNVAAFSDSTRASGGKKSVRITFTNEVVPYTQIWQKIPMEPNQEYAISYDVFVGDDFQGDARGLVYSGDGMSHLTSNYEETSVDGQLTTRDRCDKDVAVMTATEAIPAEISHEIAVEPGMNFQAGLDIRNKTFKGIVSFLVEDAVSGEILNKIEVKDVKETWQVLSMRFQSKSAKIWKRFLPMRFQGKSSRMWIRLSARGEGLLQADNITVTFPEVVPALQEAKWLPASENFFIPSQWEIYLQGQSGKAIAGGLELLGNDLKNCGVTLAKTGSEKALLQISIGADYAAKGKGPESYTLKITKKGITIKAGEEPGAFYGLMTLLQLVEKQKDRPFALACEITDYPDMPLRGAMNLDPAEQAARWKLNTFIQGTGYPTSIEEKKGVRDIVQKYERLNLKVIPNFMALVGGYYVQKINPNLAAGIWVKDEQLTLRGTEPSPLANRYVIRTGLTDVKLKSPDGKEEYVLGKDYQVINGDIAYPYNQSNPKPFAISRIPGSSIPDGTAVLASYDYVSHYRESTRRTEEHIPYCPAEPQVQELMGEHVKNLARDYPFSYIHPSHCLMEFFPSAAMLETDSRVIKSGKKPIELLVEDVCFLDKAAKSGNPRARIFQWAGSVNDYSREAGPKLPKDALINIWGYTANWPAGYGREAIDYWSNLGFETSVMPWNNLRNVRGWAQVVAEARRKGYPCLGMIKYFPDPIDVLKETAIVSWKIPKEGERGFVSLPKGGH